MRTSLLAGAAIVAALFAATASGDARACGGCFAAPPPPGQNVDTVVTSQRMIFVVSQDSTTLYDEIQYSGSPSAFAWVLPIRGPVTVGISADAVFAAFDAATATTVTPPTLPPCPTCPACGENAGFECPDGDTCADGATLSADDGPEGEKSVTVLSQAVVGPYETVQLSSTKPNALSAWLAANSFDLPSSFAPVIAAYIAEGFDFLAVKLVPGQGVQAMRPVRVTTPGAGLSMPLRMVSAGAGATIGVTFWIVGDGTYVPQNFTRFVLPASDLVWDFSTSLSNYSTLRTQREAALNYDALQMESTLTIPAYEIENAVTSSDYLAVPGGDGGADAGQGESQYQVMADDFAILFGGSENTNNRVVTRMSADLSQAALANDLVVMGTNDPTIPRSNVYQAGKYVNAPACPALPDPCPCNADGSPIGGNGGHSGCVSAPTDLRDGAPELIVLAMVGLVVARSRRKR